MNKKQIRLTESDLKRIVKESVSKILKEAKKKDPMQQWFKDMEDIQKHRDNMEYITKGGRKPKHWNESDLHRIVKESVNRVLNEGWGTDPKYENSYRECIRLLEKAQSAIITDYSHDNGYDENDPYYQDLDNKHWSIIRAIDNAIDTCKKAALNGRGGTFDADNGYLSDPSLAGVNGG